MEDAGISEFCQLVQVDRQVLQGKLCFHHRVQQTPIPIAHSVVVNLTLLDDGVFTVKLLIKPDLVLQNVDAEPGEIVLDLSVRFAPNSTGRVIAFDDVDLQV